MKKSAIITITTFALWIGGASWAPAADRPSAPMPPASEEMTEKGMVIYFRRCSFCHGLLGDGDGPAARYLDPRPRDFTLGTFKFRTTVPGELPTNEDIFRIISNGMPGTSMQTFDSDLIRNGLSEEERWQVISYIKTFAFEFEDPELDPVTTGKVIALPENRAPYNEETIARGKEIYKEAKCFECHGNLGRGDGSKELKNDDWGFPIRIRNVTHPWKIKGGTEVEDIYMRFSTGINGTPMPSYAKALSAEKRWYMANFVKSFQHQATQHQVLRARRTEGEVPEAPDDPAWARAEPMDMRLTGQVLAAPRWQNQSIELATVRAIFNEKEIAFLVEWDDPFKDVIHKADRELDAKKIGVIGALSSYLEANGAVRRTPGTYRDSIALQFPIKLPKGNRKPHFFRGNPSNPVHLWFWKADLDAQGKPSVVEALARGWKQPAEAQPEDQQQVGAKAVWDQGRWSVAMKRPLITKDRNDIQFVPGKFIPMALNSWDGSNGEHGLVMSLSTWYYVFLEAPTQMQVYVYTVLAFLLTGALGYWLVRKAEGEGDARS